MYSVCLCVCVWDTYILQWKCITLTASQQAKSNVFIIQGKYQFDKKKSERHWLSVFSLDLNPTWTVPHSNLANLWLASFSASKVQPITVVPGYVDVSLKSESFTSVSPALVQHQTMTLLSTAITILSTACEYTFFIYLYIIYRNRNACSTMLFHFVY